MSLQCQLIIRDACQIAKTPFYTSQASDFLVTILDDLCQTADLEESKGFFQFNFNPGLISQIVPGVPGGGPYNLPADYLRVINDDFFYTISGFQYPMIPVDQAEMDLTPIMAGLSTYPQWYATDLAPNPPQVTVWPPPAGAYPVTLRYRRQMPSPANGPGGDLSTSTAIPWFRNAAFLIQKLAAQLMQLANDDRWEKADDKAMRMLDRYLKLANDSTNRATSVMKDRRRFGPAYGQVLPTKSIPW